MIPKCVCLHLTSTKLRIFATNTEHCTYNHTLYGKLRERERWGEFCVLIGYPSGQDGPILPAQGCLFCSRNKISPKHESFLLQNTFRGRKKIFCDFSVGMELGNEKTDSVNENENITFAYNWLPFQCSKINKSKISFSVFFMPYNKSFIDQASSVKMAAYWPRSLSVFL